MDVYYYNYIGDLGRGLAMVKSVLGVSHQGLRDWVLQRATAILMAVYSIAFIAYFVFHPDLSYLDWQLLFSHAWMKVASILFIACLLFHAWIGLWTIFTDYIKYYVIRVILSFLVQLMLVACFFWGLVILWSV
jgi:succinate dehydrogenase / fumarate reductase membrane anchor subunit